MLHDSNDVIDEAVGESHDVNTLVICHDDVYADEDNADIVIMMMLMMKIIMILMMRIMIMSLILMMTTMRFVLMDKDKHDYADGDDNHELMEAVLMSYSLFNLSSHYGYAHLRPMTTSCVTTSLLSQSLSFPPSSPPVFVCLPVRLFVFLLFCSIKFPCCDTSAPHTRKNSR